ncbi:hypothetical protein IQ06DRAFT_311949 [Phaeosphaeriaceae sp. SRC1lsM3a]|nr:hypothetical protein IQ06DRAFT_311949 [Stagonospora sp. SRC1lsM3a]
MRFISTALFCALFAAPIAAIPAALAVVPPAGGVSLALTVDMEGGGCKPGEAKAAIAYDNSAITIILDNFQAAQGPAAGNLKSRAFCRVIIGVNSPGYAFDITSADFRGYVKLDQGVEASLVSRWKWIDASGADLKGKGNIHKIVNGPFSDDVLLHKDGELSGSEATVCQKKDAKLSISLSATVSANVANANGYIQGSAQDFGFSQILNLSWKKC